MPDRKQEAVDREEETLERIVLEETTPSRVDPADAAQKLGAQEIVDAVEITALKRFNGTPN